MGKLSEALKNKVTERGGEIKTETKITEVIPEKFLVTDENNITYKYKNLIWAADLKTLYKRTETEGLLPETKKDLGRQKARCWEAGEAIPYLHYLWKWMSRLKVSGRLPTDTFFILP